MLFHAAQGLSLLRMAFGLYFVVSALRKTTTGWLDSGQALSGFVQQHLEASPPLYSSFLETTVLPNADRFSHLILLGEWVAGLSLLFGFLTRLGALSGMWLMVNYMLAKGLPDFDGSQDRLFFASCAVFALSAAGLVWGLDGTLRPSLQAHTLTRWLAGIPSRPQLVRARGLAPAPRRAARRHLRRPA
jgi:thiosulfate dehydrogenase [quinone] large subunit